MPRQFVPVEVLLQGNVSHAGWGQEVCDCGSKVWKRPTMKVEQPVVDKTASEIPWECVEGNFFKIQITAQDTGRLITDDPVRSIDSRIG